MEVINIHDVWKTFRIGEERTTLLSALIQLGRRKKPHEVEALRGVGLTVKRGERIGLIGSNGSGKTTLMRVVAGIYAPNRGTVKVQGRIASLLQLGTGTIGRLTVTENIFLYGAIMGLTRPEIRERYHRILDFAELGDFAHARVGQLSTGMNQRLTFSVAVQVDAEILLLDEVLAVGDQHFKNKCYEFFENTLTADKTMLFCSHNLKEIEKFCSRTIWLDKGQAVACGPTDAVLRSYKEANGYPLEESDIPRVPSDRGTSASMG